MTPTSVSFLLQTLFSEAHASAWGWSLAPPHWLLLLSLKGQSSLLGSSQHGVSLAFFTSGLSTEETWPILSLTSRGHAEHSAGRFFTENGWLLILMKWEALIGTPSGPTLGGHPRKVTHASGSLRRLPRGSIQSGPGVEAEGEEGKALLTGPHGGASSKLVERRSIRFQILSEPHFASFVSSPCSEGLCPEGQAFYLWSIYFILF